MRILKLVSFASLLIVNLTNFAFAFENSKSGDKAKIIQLLNKYEAALNESSTEKVVPLYTKNGIFMPTEAPTAKGTEQLTASYNDVFGTIKLAIKFSIEEVIVSKGHAYAVTVSKGKVTILSNGKQVPEENRELFVFRKDNGDWKILRYMFNKAKRSE